MFLAKIFECETVQISVQSKNLRKQNRLVSRVVQANPSENFHSG